MFDFKPKTPIRTFVKANSVEFLDLSAPELHETRETTLIYALDLSVAPQRYYYIQDWFDYTRGETIVYLRRRLETGNFPSFNHFKNRPVCSSKKLIELARLDDLDVVELTFPFIDFVLNVFESVSRNWESEIIRIYLKYVKRYCRHLEESIIIPCLDSGKIILTFEIPPIAYDICFNPRFLYEIEEAVNHKLILMLCENNSADSSLIAEIFRSNCIDWKRILFEPDAKGTEYLLKHLKTEKYDIRHIFETLEESTWARSLLRSYPEYLVVFLNYGLKIKPEPRFKDIEYLGNHPSYQDETYWAYRISGEWSDLKLREKAIFDIFFHFVCLSAQFYAAHLNCIRYIWRSIPDAFLTYEEMTTFLLRIADIADVEDICSELQKSEFESCDTILQPRSLSHYSRCVLRDALNRNSQLPEGIEFLALPGRLKSYLRLEF